MGAEKFIKENCLEQLKIAKYLLVSQISMKIDTIGDNIVFS